MIALPAHLRSLIAAPKTKALFSEKAMLAKMLAVEAAYLRAMAGLGLIKDAKSDLAAIEKFTPQYDALAKATGHDGVVVPELVRQLREAGCSENAHKGMTSQDVIDTALTMSLRQINGDLAFILNKQIEKLTALKKQFGKNTIMARTRMQAALPIRAETRIDTWREPLRDLLAELERLRPITEIISLGGPVGDGRYWGSKRDVLIKAMADELKLHPSGNWHSNRSAIIDYGNWLAKLTGVMGKIGQDIALMAQNGIDEITLSGGGGSSAMPHKSNPIKAETLVALARFNAAQSGGLNQAMVHEQERSGAAWTLEWLILPQMVASTEGALNLLDQLLDQIKAFGLEEKAPASEK